MNTLVVSCHPSEDSFHAYIRNTVLAALGPSTRHVDVYRSPSVDDIDWAESLVFVYPTWWSTLPAPLLAWTHTAFSQPRHSIRAIAAVTTHGSGRWVNTLEGGVGKRLLMRGVTSLCAPDCTTKWIAMFGIDRSSPEERSRFVARVTRELTGR